MVKAVSKIFILIWFLIFINNPFCSAQIPDTIVQNDSSYSFIVAGHTMGAHYQNNFSLYPKFYNKLKIYSDNYDFIVLTGDITHKSRPWHWEAIQKDLDKLNKPYFFSMGNHDVSCCATEVFKKRFGNTYYSFTIKNELYIVLNTQLAGNSIKGEQLQFLKKTITESNSKNVFIFIHEFIWNNKEKYKYIFPNERSRYIKGAISNSNFWIDIFPFLSNKKNKTFYIIAGDTGARTNSIPVFYEKLNNVFLLGSGMGEIEEENFLLININKSISIKAIPLDNNIKLKNIEEYNLKYLNGYYKPRFETIYSKFLLNILNRKFIMGFVSSFILFTFLFFIIIYRIKKRKNKNSNL